MKSKNKFPGKLITVSVIHFYYALVSLIMFLIGLITFEPIPTTIGLFFMVIYLLSGIGIFFLNRAARKTALVLAIIGLFEIGYEILNFIYIGFNSAWEIPTLPWIIFTILNFVLAIIIIRFLTDKKIKKLFKK